MENILRLRCERDFTLGRDEHDDDIFFHRTPKRGNSATFLGDSEDEDVIENTDLNEISNKRLLDEQINFFHYYGSKFFQTTSK